MSDPHRLDDAARSDLAGLQGLWRTVAVEIDGSPVAPWLFKDAILEIAGNHFTLHNPLPDAEQRTEGTFQLNARITPKELNLILESGPITPEIYELEGDTLKTCYPTAGNVRPVEFKTSPQSNLSLVVYKREKRGPTS